MIDFRPSFPGDGFRNFGTVLECIIMMGHEPKTGRSVVRGFEDQTVGLIKPALHNPLSARSKLFYLERRMPVVFHQKENAFPYLGLNVFGKFESIDNKIICEQDTVFGHEVGKPSPFLVYGKVAGLLVHPSYFSNRV
jgi:hypothetical protein